MQFTDLLGLLWKRRFLVALVMIASIASSAAVSFTQPAKYEATATLALTPDVTRGQGFVASDNLSALLGTYAATAKAKVNLRRASSILGRPLPGEVKTDTQAGTGILRIIGRATSPRAAADTAGAAAQAFQTSIDDNRLLVADLVEPATPPEAPVQPRPPLIMGVAGVLGLLMGSMLALAMERLRRRVETASDVSEVTDAPIIGRIPRHRILTRGLAQPIWDSEKLVGLQEGYRALRTNFEFLAGGEGSVIQITSPDAAQGKSTVVANLGIALAQIGIETVIIDADLRRPQLHRIFELDNSRGLSTLMAMPSSKFGPVPTGYANLSVLPSGPIPPDSTEMLHVRFKRVLDRLRPDAATILIDSPPLLPVSDARLIATHTDGVLLVLAAGATKPSALHGAVEKLNFAGAVLLGVVLNQSGEDDHGSGGYGYYDYSEQAPAAVSDKA